MLRPLRVLRLISLLSVLNRRTASSVRGQVAMYVAAATGLVVFCAALAVLDAERAHPEANITSFADAVWWSMTTVTTVGYGNHYPLTGAGRAVAGILMLGGIALLGMVTASLASWLLERVREVETIDAAPTRQDIDMLSRQLADLRAEIRDLYADTAADGAPKPS